MSTEIVQKSVFDPLAEKYNMASAAQVLQILKATVLKPSQGYTPTDADAAAFAIVCTAFDLNPFRREIHGFCDKEKGVVPIVGIDGWAKIVNQQPLDGFDFVEVEGEDGKPIKTTCTMYVKGRSKPAVVTERYAECKRSSAPWSTMPYRMLRHKAFMQCARLAFSLSGIYDEDEARDIIGGTVITSADGVPVIDAGTPVAQPSRTEMARKAFAPADAAGGVNPEPVVEPEPPKKPKAPKAPKATEKPQDDPADFADNLPGESNEAAPTVNPAGETPSEASGEVVGKETGEVLSAEDAKKAAVELVQSRAGELVVAVRSFFKGMALDPAKGYIKSILRAGGWQLHMLEDEKTFDDVKDLLTRWCELHKLAAGDQTLPADAGFDRVSACLADASVSPLDLLDDRQLAFVKKVVKKAAADGDWGTLLKKHKK